MYQQGKMSRIFELSLTIMADVAFLPHSSFPISAFIAPRHCNIEMKQMCVLAMRKGCCISQGWKCQNLAHSATQLLNRKVRLLNAASRHCPCNTASVGKLRLQRSFRMEAASATQLLFGSCARKLHLQRSFRASPGRCFAGTVFV